MKRMFLALHPRPNLECHSLSTVRHCLFNILQTTRHFGTSVTKGGVEPSRKENLLLHGTMKNNKNDNQDKDYDDYKTNINKSFIKVLGDSKKSITR